MSNHLILDSVFISLLTCTTSTSNVETDGVDDAGKSVQCFERTRNKMKQVDMLSLLYP